MVNVISNSCYDSSKCLLLERLLAHERVEVSGFKKGLTLHQAITSVDRSVSKSLKGSSTEVFHQVRDTAPNFRVSPWNILSRCALRWWRTAMTAWKNAITVFPSRFGVFSNFSWIILNICKTVSLSTFLETDHTNSTTQWSYLLAKACNLLKIFSLFLKSQYVSEHVSAMTSPCVIVNKEDSQNV